MTDHRKKRHMIVLLRGFTRARLQANSFMDSPTFFIDRDGDVVEEMIEDDLNEPSPNIPTAKDVVHETTYRITQCGAYYANKAVPMFVVNGSPETMRKKEDARKKLGVINVALYHVIFTQRFGHFFTKSTCVAHAKDIWEMTKDGRFSRHECLLIIHDTDNVFTKLLVLNLIELCNP